MFSFLFLLFLPPSFPLENRKKKTIGLMYAHLALTFFFLLSIMSNQNFNFDVCSSPCMLHQGNRKFKNFRPPKPQLINRKHIWQTTRSARVQLHEREASESSSFVAENCRYSVRFFEKAIVKNQTPVNDIMNKADYQIQ